MRSVADELRAERRAVGHDLPSDERVELAWRLGDDDLAAYCAARRLDRVTALQRIRALRQMGRMPSRCAAEEPPK